MREALKQKEINAIFTYADCNMNTSAAAPYLGVSRWTLNRYLSEVYRKTGYDPNEFWDLHKIVTILETEDDDGREAGS